MRLTEAGQREGNRIAARKWYAANKANRAEYRHRPERRAASCKSTAKWRAAHPEQGKEYYLRTKVKVAERSKKRYQANILKIKAQAHVRYLKNFDKVKSQVAARRALQRAVMMEHVSPEEIYDRDQWECQICHKAVNRNYKWPHPFSKSMDHIIPLSKGGTHTYTNIHLAHLRCNLQAGTGGIKQLRLF